MKNKKLPSKVDLRSQHPIIYNQGELGSSTACAVAAAYNFEQTKKHRIKFLYYFIKKI